MDKSRPNLLWIRIAGVIGALFGLMTLREGGAVLFVDGAARVAAGDYVPFVSGSISWLALLMSLLVLGWYSVGPGQVA